MRRVNGPPKTASSLSEENPFALSIGDLMAGLVFVFILLLAAALLQVKEIQEETVRVTSEYEAVQDSLCQDLRDEFSADITSWNASIQCGTLTIRFTKPEVLFVTGSSEVRPGFRAILVNFFPRLVSILQEKSYKDHIDEVRIEGHTSPEWTTEVGEKEAYYLNMSLSQSRTRNVLRISLESLTDSTESIWTQERLTANGLSSSQPIRGPDGQIDHGQSRRVEFRIRTDAEKQLEKLFEKAILGVER